MRFDSKKVRDKASKLAKALSKEIGDKNVIDDPDLLDGVAGDESHLAPARPDLLIRAREKAHVVACLREASRLGVPVTPRGGGTGKAGGAIPIFGGVVLDTSFMKRIVQVDRENLMAVVESGVITGELQQAVEDKGLFYPPDPNSLETCCLGGNIAHNAGGPRAFKYGVTRNYVMGLQAVLMGGEVLETGRRTIKSAAGYDLTGLLVGSEGTLGVFTSIRLSLLQKPRALATLLALFSDELKAGRTVAKVVDNGLCPRVLEFLDSTLVDIVRKSGVDIIPEGTGAVLLVELDGSTETVVEEDLDRFADIADDAGASDVLVAKHGGDRDKLWAARRALTDAVKAKARFKVAEDIAVPRSEAATLLERLRDIQEKHGVLVASYGHAGDGNFHVNVLWDDPEWNVEPALLDIFRLALDLGGTITGEHGVGLAKKKYLPLEKTAAQINWMKSIKDRFDPSGLLNPGKIF
jgi:glycolate oxidase